MSIKLENLFDGRIQNPLDIIRFLAVLPKFIKLLYRLFRDARVQFHLKVMLILTLAYVVSPIDLIPDWILPIVGQVDDLIILIAGVRYFLRHCPPAIVNEHVLRIERGF
ncbi:MAG: DUF1232 domain-containing protein [candidate division KSB1 bacterium]|nr:DUF1232 domain-containing protein [candidate division KSB1 bacterium]MDZ7339841.1 DUF1232 domain-containing protein [candidate division KSB1 bacterium]